MFMVDKEKKDKQKKVRDAVSACISQKVRSGCQQDQAVAMCISMHKKEADEVGLKLDASELASEQRQSTLLTNEPPSDGRTRPDANLPGKYPELDTSQELPDHLRARGNRKQSELEMLLNQP